MLICLWVFLQLLRWLLQQQLAEFSTVLKVDSAVSCWHLLAANDPVHIPGVQELTAGDAPGLPCCPTFQGAKPGGPEVKAPRPRPQELCGKQSYEVQYAAPICAVSSKFLGNYVDAEGSALSEGG